MQKFEKNTRFVWWKNTWKNTKNIKLVSAWKMDNIWYNISIVKESNERESGVIKIIFSIKQGKHFLTV